MGVVYRAYDPQIGRSVAIKTISLSGPEFANAEDYRGRFLREARAAGRLSHPGIVTIFDAGQDPETGEPYLVMEYITGQPLSKTLSRTRKLPLLVALQFAQEIAEALDYAHTQGVVHRDIKPANILITEDNHAKITDFGVAWLNEEMTQAGEVVGSPAYMAPEQMAGKHADARSDLFSLGVVLYTMITGFRPFQGNSAKTVVFKVMNIEPVPVASFQSDIPPELNAIVSRAIAKNPDERYPSGATLARALRAFRETGFAASEATEFPRAILGEVKPAANAPSPVKKLYQRFSLAVALLCVAISGSLFAWRMTNVHDTPLSPELIAQLRLHPVHALRMATTKVVTDIAKPVAHKLQAHRKPKPIIAPPPPVPHVDPSNVEVEIRHNLNGAKASIWLDDDLIFTETLHGADEKHLLRAVEVEQISNVQFAAGKHWVQVRVVSPGNAYDQIETIDADLAPGSSHVLYVRCEKHKMQVELQ